MPKLHFIKQSHGLRSLGRAKLSDKRLVMHVAQEIKNPCEDSFHFQGHLIPKKPCNQHL